MLKHLKRKKAFGRSTNLGSAWKLSVLEEILVTAAWLESKRIGKDAKTFTCHDSGAVR
jgi:hypothetical protein